MVSSSKIADDTCWQAFELNNGHKLPAIGFGTFCIQERDDVMLATESALRAGYRLFDTASVYGNEVHIGEALNTFLPKFDLTRDDVFVTSKLSNSDHSTKKRVLDAFAKSETNLGLTPDLFLIHFPGSAKLEPKDSRNKLHRHTAWSAMAELYDTGRVNSIGVSNFTVYHLEELLKVYHSDIPVVNQVEWHPYYYDIELLKFCNKNSIQLQGYHSLGGTKNCEILLKKEVIKEIANTHLASPSQVLLTWSLQRGVAVIPKSTKPQHMIENLSLNFNLSSEENHKIDTLVTEQVKFAWDPNNII